MNREKEKQNGQGALEYVILIVGAVLVAFLVIIVLLNVSPVESTSDPGGQLALVSQSPASIDLNLYQDNNKFKGIASSIAKIGSASSASITYEKGRDYDVVISVPVGCALHLDSSFSDVQDGNVSIRSIDCGEKK